MGETRKLKELKSGDVVKLEKPGDSVSGTFISIEESRMYKDSYALKLKNPAKDQPIVVFVSNIVLDMLKSNNVQPGQDIMVEFIGKEKSQSSGMEYKNYRVFA